MMGLAWLEEDGWKKMVGRRWLEEDGWKKMVGRRALGWKKKERPGPCEPANFPAVSYRLLAY